MCVLFSASSLVIVSSVPFSASSQLFPRFCALTIVSSLLRPHNCVFFSEPSQLCPLFCAFIIVSSFLRPHNCVLFSASSQLCPLFCAFIIMSSFSVLKIVSSFAIRKFSFLRFPLRYSAFILTFI